MNRLRMAELALFSLKRRVRLEPVLGCLRSIPAPPKFCLNKGEVDASVRGTSFNYTVRGS